MMVYREENGRPVVNWQYVDLVYDHWLSIGIRPFVELSFMPYDLASVWDSPDRLLKDVRGFDKILRALAYPDIERHYTEWSSSPSPRDSVHDTAFMTSFIVDNNWRARGLMDSLSFWVVSDIFEEGRQGDTPFHGGFGLVNVQGLKKASYHGYWFLSRLGDEALAQGDSYAVTRRRDGTLAVLMWNYCHYCDDANDSRLLAAAYYSLCLNFRKFHHKVQV